MIDGHCAETRSQRLYAFDGVSFPVKIGHGLVDEFVFDVLSLDPDKAIIITDSTVLALHARKFSNALSKHIPTKILSGVPGEAMKSLSVLHDFLESAVSWGVTRKTIVVAFGGGVSGNIAGLVASLLFRGIRLVHCPTTLLAALDSVISLKQAVNSGQGKNLFGCYLVPSMVLVDTALMETLPAQEWRSGLCEVAKNALAIRPAMIERLLTELRPDRAPEGELLDWIIRESIGSKIQLMCADRYEKKAAIRLEYGHTVGHAIELAAGQGAPGQGISHGEAVGIGMIAAAEIAARQGFMAAPCLALHHDLLARVGAPRTLPLGLDAERVMRFVKRDNKRGYVACGQRETPMVLLRAPGQPLGDADLPLVPVALDLIRETLNGLALPDHSRSRMQDPICHPIGVIMVTDGRRPYLHEALRSVFNQRYDGDIDVLVLIDGGIPIERKIRDLPLPSNVSLRFCAIQADDGVFGDAVIERVARLRNIAVSLMDAPMVAFIDDDNLWEANHLDSLFRTLRNTGARAVHSYRRLIWADGRDAVVSHFPWLPVDDDRNRDLFEIYRQAGVFQQGSPIVLDSVSIPIDGQDYGMVDMGAWLFQRDLLVSIPFSTHFSQQEQASRVGEDDKLLWAMRKNGVSTSSSGLPTLRYRLGGFSNNLANNQ